MAPSLDCLVSSLLCAENTDSICYDDNDDYDYFKGFNGIKNLQTEYSVLDLPLQNDECVNLLMRKECEQFVGFVDYFNKFKNGNLDLVARQEAVDWISKVHAHFNFGPLCAYLSINYLDRFLAVYELPKDKDWMMQLLAVTCLSLASKMEETEIPLILDLQACESRFVFEAKTIQKMELLVLNTLKWRMQSVTPFSFLDSFIGNVNDGQSQTDSRSFILKSTQLILGLIKGIAFLEFRPSEIAAAVAISVVGVEETQISALFQHVDKERVVKCVEVVKCVRNSCTMCAGSGTMTSFPESPNGVLEAAFLSYDSPTCVKRRRLNDISEN